MESNSAPTQARRLFYRGGMVILLLLGLLGVLPATPVAAATRIVPDSYPTIQAAVNAAAPGDLVYVRAGLYNEHVSINKALTLQGVSRSQVVINGSGSGDAILASVAFVNITNLTVTNAVNGIHFSVSDYGNINDVMAAGNSGAGIFLQQSNYTTVTNSFATGNTLGIDLGDQGSTHTVISALTAYSNTNTGINGYSGSNNTTVVNSTVYGNTSKGMGIGWSQNWTISGCALYSNGNGIYFDTVATIAVTNNSIYGNGNGIRFTGLYANGGSFENNSLHENTTALAFSNDAHGNLVRYNDIYNNGTGAAFLNNPTRENYSNTFYQNAFIGNTTQVSMTPAYNNNAWDNGYPGGGNYWSNYGGADAFNGAGQNVAGRDGMGDTALLLATGTNVDRYPLMGLYASNDGPTLYGNATHLSASTLLARSFSYTWAFGDTTGSSGASVTHTYPAPGPFTATASASNGAITLSGSTGVTITPHTNANLGNLVFSTGPITPTFASGVTGYSQVMGSAVTGLTVTPTVQDPTATVRVNGTLVTSGAASGTISLSTGANTITILVTAQDGVTTKTYTAGVTRTSLIIVPDHYGIIQAAVNAASPGDTVLVRAGTYPENVSINKALTLTGEARSNTIVDGSGSGDVFYVHANDVHMSGFTLRNGTYGIHYYQSNNGSINDVLATGNTTAGIFLQQSNYTTVEDSNVTGSTYGIDLGNAGSTHTTITRLAAYSNTGTGINGYSGSDFTSVIDSSVHNNPRGFAIGWSYFWTIAETEIYSNSTGLYFDTQDTSMITDCDFYSNTEGVRFTGFYADGNIFNGNRFHDNTTGLSFANDAHHNTIISNDIYENTTGVAFVNNSGRESHDNSFYQNAFIDNDTQVSIASVGFANAWDNGYPGGGNYWSGYTGVDAFNGSAQSLAGRDGIGDTPQVLATSTNVDRYPLMGLYVTNDGPTLYSSATDFTASTLLVRPFAYSWTFGDTTTGSGPAPEHTYPTPGEFSAQASASYGEIALDGNTEVTVLPHTNANLNNLVLSSGALTPAFDSGTIDYTQAVGHAVTSVTVTSTVEDITATVRVNGTLVTSGAASGSINLNVGENTITTVVTAQDGVTTKTYTVTISRTGASDANLSSLVFSTGALTPIFSDGTISYTQTLNHAVTSLTVIPTVADSNATVKVNGTAVTSGVASGSIDLNVGVNTITTVVTAQDGVTTKTYTVSVSRAGSSNADLSNLVLSSGGLTPAFDAATFAYTQSVMGSVSSLTVTPTAADATASITVNGTAVASGAASGPIHLVGGPNLITVIITAQDGITTKTYTVTISYPHRLFLPMILR